MTNAEIGKSIELGSVATNYHDIGEGPPLLMIHGSGPGVSAWANWRLPIAALSPHFRL
ncbi:MAG: alpha/beta fold hydrolase [Sphingomonadaceae bacterium]